MHCSSNDIVTLLGRVIVVDILTTAGSSLVNRIRLLGRCSELLLSVGWRGSAVALIVVASLVVALVVIWLLAGVPWPLTRGRAACPSSERVGVSTHAAAATSGDTAVANQ